MVEGMSVCGDCRSAGECAGVLAERDDRVAQQIRGGLAAGEEQELKEAEDLRLREALALELRIQQTREEVVARGMPARIEQPADVVVHLTGDEHKLFGDTLRP